MIGIHLDLISRTCALPHVKAALDPHRSALTAYQEMRDHYEHFDERLPGQRNRHRLAVPGDLGNFLGHTLTFGGRKVDVGPESLTLLKSIVSEVLFALKVGTLEKLSKGNPRILNGWFTPLRIKYIQREIQRRFAAPRRKETRP